MRLLVVHNADAGTGDWTRERLEPVLLDAAHEPRFIDADDDWRTALAESAEEGVVVVGGDGTVSDVALAMRRRSEPLAIIPAGTANNIARSFIGDLAYDLAERVRGWGAEEHELRIASATEADGAKPFLEVAGAGAFADFLLEERKLQRRHGVPAQLLDARSLVAEMVLRADEFDATIAIDGSVRQGRFILIACLNLPSFGPRLTLAPAELPHSGLLTVFVVPASDRDAFGDWLADPVRDSDHWRIGRGRSVTLTTSAATHCDGTAQPGRRSSARTLLLEGDHARVRVWI